MMVESSPDVDPLYIVEQFEYLHLIYA